VRVFFFFILVLHCVINTFPYCLVREVFTDYGHLFAGFEYLIGDVMVRVLTSSAVDRGSISWREQVHFSMRLLLGPLCTRTTRLVGLL
jgi:hypothetical protein